MSLRLLNDSSKSTCQQPMSALQLVLEIAKQSCSSIACAKCDLYRNSFEHIEEPYVRSHQWIVCTPGESSSSPPWQQAFWGVGVGAGRSVPGGRGSLLLPGLQQTPPDACRQQRPREPSWAPPGPEHPQQSCPCKPNTTRHHRMNREKEQVENERIEKESRLC